jgi:hypothetical protein
LQAEAARNAGRNEEDQIYRSGGQEFIGLRSSRRRNGGFADGDRFALSETDAIPHSGISYRKIAIALIHHRQSFKCDIAGAKNLRIQIRLQLD